MSRPIIVLCAGGHSKVLINVLLLNSRNIVGVADNNSQKHGGFLLGVKVIGDDEVVLNYTPESVHLVNGLGSVESMRPRRLLFEKFAQKGYQFASVIHPSAVVAHDVALCEGAQIMAGAVIQPGASIGANTIVNTRASVDHDCCVGAHSHLAPGVVLSGGVSVGDEVHLGTGAVVIHNIKIGGGSLVGAGAVVTSDVPEGSRVAGAPARKLGR